MCIKKNMFWLEGSGFGKLGGTPTTNSEESPPPHCPRVKFMDQLIGTSDMSDIGNFRLLIVAVSLVVDR